MAGLDVATKVLLQVAPRGILGLAFPGVAIQSVEPQESEVVAQELRMDKLFAVRVAGEQDPRWLQAEVEASWKHDVPDRTFRRWSLAQPRHPELEAFVLVLKPGARQGRPSGHYLVRDRRTGEPRLDFRFGLVCAWELDGDELLARGDPGLLPLVPFARGASVARVDETLGALHDACTPAQWVELSATLLAFAGNAFPAVPWLDRLPQEILMESTVYQQIREMALRDGRREGLREGKREGERRLLALQLRERLEGRADPYLARLEAARPKAIEEAAKLLARPISTAKLLRELDALLPGA